MVTYGPWQTPVTYTEQWTYGASESGLEFGLQGHTIDPIPTQFGTPMTRNQWLAAGGLAPEAVGRVFGFGEEQRLSIPDAVPPYEEPDFGTDIPSQEAWLTAVNGDGGETASTTVAGPVAIDYAGSVGPNLPSGFLHQETWSVESFEAAPVFRIRTGSTNWNALAGIPNDEPDGALFAEIDPARSTSSLLSEAVSMRLEFDLNADVGWSLVVKDFAGPSTGWLLTADDRTPTTGRAGADLGASGSFDFDVSPMESWRADWADGAPAPTAALPEFGVFWATGWPGNFTGSPPPTYPLAALTIVIAYRWKAPRWRWVYEDIETVPYRRVYPRDDGLGGGAPRVYPPSKSTQAGIRTFGGYL